MLPKPVGDGPDYENIAFHLWQGRGFVYDSTDLAWRAAYERSNQNYAVHLGSAPRNYPTTARPPLFPVIVAGIYSALGRNEWAFSTVRLFSATCLALAGALAVQLTVQVLGGLAEAKADLRMTTGASWKPPPLAMGGVATLILVAVNRTLREYATDFLTEPLALLLMQIFVMLTIALCSAEHRVNEAGAPSWFSRREVRLGLSAGAVLGGLILTRSMFIVWLPAIWILFFAALPSGRFKRLNLSTLVVVTACMVCAPWWVRNCLVLERLMPLGTQGATTLIGGYSDAALAGNGDWQPEPEQQLRHALSQRSDFQGLESDTARELVVAQQASRHLRTWLWEHLRDMPVLVARRVYVHWNPYSGASLLWKIPLILGAIGLIAMRVRASYWLLGLPLTSTVVVAVFYSTGGRFLVPLYGVLFTVAGLGVGLVAGMFTRRLKATNRTGVNEDVHGR